ncbi:hypothetical protein [Deinococcus sp.]|uniref:hypothetical protein n=1 Tax=Deinococcus sp. TaxID=47478 RepID=UPI00286E44F3|nr:hypothetical protein [Deinococcus sp.]
MRAYRGIIEEGVVVLQDGARLPEGTVVTVTVGEAELLRATISSAFRGQRKVRVRLKPTAGLVTELAAERQPEPV